jgi:hypothetical protein
MRLLTTLSVTPVLHQTRMHTSMCVCVCVYASLLFTSSILLTVPMYLCYAISPHKTQCHCVVMAARALVTRSGAYLLFM